MNKKIKIFFLLLLCFCQASLQTRSRKSQGKNILDLTNTNIQDKSRQNSLYVKNDSTEKELDSLVAGIEESAKKADLQDLSKETQPENSETKAINQSSETENDKILLNFENAELGNFIDYIAELNKCNIISDKTVTGNKISLTIRTPISKEHAWRILQTVVDLANFSIIKVGEVYRVIGKDKKIQQPLPVYIGTPAELLPDSDENIRYIGFLTNIKAADVRPWIDKMLGEPHVAQEFTPANAIIICDKSYNVKSAMKVIQEMDKTEKKETYAFIPLLDANATEVAKLLNDLCGEKPGDPRLAQIGLLFGQKKQDETSTYFPPGTKIIAEERSNSIILLGAQQTIEKIEKFIREVLDKKRDKVESPLHVFDLQYCDATTLVELLKESITEPESESGKKATTYGSIRGGVKYFKKMVLKADKEGNRIIASCPDKKDWKLLKQTIRDLDKPQPQVAIEALIVDIDKIDEKAFGGHVRSPKANTLGNFPAFQGPGFMKTVLDPNSGSPQSLLGNLLYDVTGQLGSTILSFGRINNIWMILQMLETFSHATVLSKPFLTISNKYESTVYVKRVVRVITQSAGPDANSLKGMGDNEATIELTVKPQINPNGFINLTVHVEYSDFLNTAGTNKVIRKLDTSVSVANGQVLALGGFLKTGEIDEKAQTPFLGSLPIIGWMFKNKNKTIQKSHILIFLSPTIIKPKSKPGIDLYTKIKIDQSKEAINYTGSLSNKHDFLDKNFFNPGKKTSYHDLDDFGSGKFQPVSVDIKNDLFYRTKSKKEKERELIFDLNEDEEEPNTEDSTEIAEEPKKEVQIKETKD